MSKKARDRKKQLRKDIREYKQYLKNKFEEVEKQVVLHTFLDIKGSEYNFNEPTIKWQTPTPESYDGKKIVHEDTYSVFGDYSSKPKNQLIEEIRAKLTESDKETTDLFFDKINEEPILSAEELKKVIGDSKRKWNYI